MAKIIVFHYREDCQVPKLTEQELADVKQAYADELANHPDVKMIGVFIDEHGRGFCEWDAPDIDTVKQIIMNATGEQPGDVVTEVKDLFG